MPGIEELLDSWLCGPQASVAAAGLPSMRTNNPNLAKECKYKDAQKQPLKS